MKLIPYDKSKIENIGGYNKTKNQKILEEFINSNIDCAEVKDFTNKTACGCANSLNCSVKNFKLSGVQAISRKDRVFLIKTT